MSEEILLEEEKNQEMNDKNKYNLADYEFGKTLGKGTFGKVKEAIHLPTQ
jgi:serine/threonine protein kinase